MDKTLIVLTGNSRGGEETWQTMFKNLMEPYNADLALCFGFTNNKKNSLYKEAKYIWEIEEYQNWIDYYYKNFTNNNWLKVFEANKISGLMGGINDATGSGAIVFAIKDFLIKNYKNILQTYDRIILTRSDYFYIDKHPVLPNDDSFYVTEGDDWGGIHDRFHIFNSKDATNALDLANFICENHELILKYKNINPERVLELFFKTNGVWERIKRIKRVQFTVACGNDSTRWKKATLKLKDYEDIKIKYITEYNLALKNLEEKSKVAGFEPA